MKDKIRIHSLLARENIKVQYIKKLAGDASDRKFFRVFTPALSYIALLYPLPIDETLNMLQVYKLYSASQLPVPLILHMWPEEGILLLQDLGEENLQRYNNKNTPARVFKIYQQAISLIQKIQIIGEKKISPTSPVLSQQLNRDKLQWEMNFFLDNFLRRHLKKRITPRQQVEYQQEVASMLDLIDWQKMVLCHRDYHSRNLFLVKERIFMVDFQDTRPGPVLYDLASLLFDSYVRLGKRMREELIRFAYKVNNYGWSQEKFIAQLKVTSLQRNIKALGTFGYQIAVKKRGGYRAYIPRTLDYIEENLTSFSELRKLKNLVSKWR